MTATSFISNFSFSILFLLALALLSNHAPVATAASLPDAATAADTETEEPTNLLRIPEDTYDGENDEEVEELSGGKICLKAHENKLQN